MDDKTFWTLIAGVILGGIVVGLFLSTPSYGRYAPSKPNPKTTSKTFYTNIEEWKVIRNSAGSINGIRIKRKAEEA